MEDMQNIQETQGVPQGQGGHRWGPKQVVSLIVLLVVVIVVVIGITVFTGEKTVEIEPGQELTTASDGRVVSNFPEALLFEDGIDFSKSFSLRNIDEGTEQPVVEYTSLLSLEQNIEAFQAVLREDEWLMVRAAGLEEFSETLTTFFYARKDNEDVNITFTENRDGFIDVIISYLDKRVEE